MSEDLDPPWAMQLAVRVEKTDPPGHRAVCAAAATAAVALLTDPRAAGPDGEWFAAVTTWEDHRIRKVVRRARGVRWPEAQGVPGVTVQAYGAQARAFVPGPVDAVPPPLAKLQVAGTDLPDEGPLPPPDAAEYAVVALNPDVPMTTGKAAAQSGHAAQLLLRHGPPQRVSAWLAAGAQVLVVTAVPWAKAQARAVVTVQDGGFTEVAPGTRTAAAWFSGLP